MCGEPLFNGETIDTHHIVPVAQGGLDSLAKPTGGNRKPSAFTQTVSPTGTFQIQVYSLEVRLEPDELETLMSGS